MMMILSGDWITHVHLGIHRPIFDDDFGIVFDQLPRGGVTLAFRPAGDNLILAGWSVCSPFDTYCREVGRTLSSGRIGRGSFRPQSDPSYVWDSERGARTVELDGFVNQIIADISRQGKLDKFSRISRRTGVPLILATRVGGHPIWGWMPDGRSGPATFDGMGANGEVLGYVDGPRTHSGVIVDFVRHGAFFAVGDDASDVISGLGELCDDVYDARDCVGIIWNNFDAGVAASLVDDADDGSRMWAVDGGGVIEIPKPSEFNSA